MADILLKENWIKPPQKKGDAPHLLGGQCTVCGFCCFPFRATCSKCRRDDSMQEIALGPRAKLETFALMQVGPPDIPAPYIMAYVRTKEGALIFTLVTGCEIKEDAVHLGQEMELVLEKIKEDENGNNLIGWKFRPVEGGVQ